MEQYNNYLAILKWSLAQIDGTTSTPPKEMDEEVLIILLL